MEILNFNNKVFSLLENSEKGKANSETIFKYQQKDNLITAEYSGGGITYGKIIAIQKGRTLNMLYQCLTSENELKAGKAIADISLLNNKIMLTLNWHWLDDNNKSGTSVYLEN